MRKQLVKGTFNQYICTYKQKTTDTAKFNAGEQSYVTVQYFNDWLNFD